MTPSSTLKLLALASTLACAGGAWAEEWTIEGTLSSGSAILTNNDSGWAFNLGNKSTTDALIISGVSVDMSTANPSNLVVDLKTLDGVSNASGLKLKEIAGNAFKGKAKIEEVILPDTEAGVSIGDQSFRNCTALTNVVGLSKASSIAARAFTSSGLKGHLDLTKFTTINQESFKGTKISSVELSPNTTTINSQAFQNCSNLTGDFYLPALTTLYASAFAGTKIGSFKAPLITTINSSVFDMGGSSDAKKNATLSNVVFSAELKTVNGCAFRRCYKLGGELVYTNLMYIYGNETFKETVITNIALPRLQTLGQQVFENCTNLLHVSIGGAVRTLETSTFSGCHKLKSVSIPKARKILGSSFHTCKALTDIYMPQVTNIGSHAFNNWEAITRFKLPRCTVSLYDKNIFDGWDRMGSKKFFVHRDAQLNTASYLILTNGTANNIKGNITLYGGVWTNVVNEKTVTWAYDDRDTPNYDLTNLVTIVSADELHGDVTMPRILRVPMRDAANKIVLDANGETVLTNLTVTAIEAGAFRDNMELKTFIIPKGITRIGVEAFAGCTNLTTVLVHETFNQEHLKELKAEYPKTEFKINNRGLKIIVR